MRRVFFAGLLAVFGDATAFAASTDAGLAPNATLHTRPDLQQSVRAPTPEKSQLVTPGPLTHLYLSARLLGSFDSITAMDTSLRPGIGAFVKGRETANLPSGSFAFGERLTPSWRVEAEYVIPRKTSYTSGSTRFPTSLNHFSNKVQRATVNIYRDIALTERSSVFLMAGVGVAIARSTGWQGNDTRVFLPNTNTNLMYMVGTGLSQRLGGRHTLDLGYRFADIGNVHTSMNGFGNARNLQDEQLKGHLYAHEVLLGYRLDI